MSRIGRLAITVPAGVQIDIDGNHVAVTGPRGKLERDVAPELRLVQEDGTRTLVANMVIGVTEGYRKGLEITGVGYRAQLVGRKLQLNLGYSHPIEIDPPEGVSFEVETPVRLAVVGYDKELVGHVAARVRSTRKPEPYKGKGVRYAGEVIRRKAGKAGKIGGKK
jgi:large subunit ribosomal protein L6